MSTADSRQSYAVAGVDREIDSCQHKIALLRATIAEAVAAIERGETPPENVLNGAINKEIALHYTGMGDIYLARQDLNRAAICYEMALKLDAGQWGARMNLLKTRKNVSEDDTNKAFLMGMIADQPQNANLLCQLGKLHYKTNERTVALDCFQRAVDIDPHHADSLYWMAGIQQDIGETQAAENNYRHAVKVKPVIKVSAVKTPPDFSALLIFAPFAGNTPTEYLMAKPAYEINIFPIFPHAEYDVELLKNSGQVVINFVSDADQARDVLPDVVRLVERLGKPVINHPSKIQKTTREGIAQLLQGIPDCRLARVVRHRAGERLSALKENISFAMPVLARPAGTHGGDRFEKTDSLAALEDFIMQTPDVDHYVMEYIDYQSPDGHFRKYRFIFVDGQILPYHLAIGNEWKVHHITTDMGKNEWMQTEERAFLEKPQAVFLPKHYQALRAIQRAVGLEYFGIDCGLDKAGNLVVFETNASMLVHQHNEAFPYKTPFVDTIKRAFDAMLQKRAGEL